jgi:uncharacterized membrane protein YidH (DUF202 family)
MSVGAGNDSEDGPRPWWDWRLLAEWIVVSGLAYVVIVVGGVVLELLASDATRALAAEHRALAVLLVALIGAGFHGFVLGRWQWRILVKRMRRLDRRRWVMATFVPAFVVWLLVIAPGAVDILAGGGDTLHAFKNGFIQAIVLGPLIGLSQATALRDDTTRWRWWFAANVTTYLLGAAAYEFGKWVLTGLALPRGITPAFPLLGFLIHGVWMLWVTAPEATAQAPPPPAGHRVARPDTPT